MWLPSDLFSLCQTIIDGCMAPSRDQQHNQHGQQHEQSSQQHMPPTPVVDESPTFPLLSLPLDILTMQLPTHLPYTTLLSLRLSSRDLYTAIPAPEKRKLNQLSDCERKAVLTAIEENDEQSTRRCCVICGSWYPNAVFCWGPGKEGNGHGCKEADGIENRVCRWHRARFERTISRLNFDDEPMCDEWTLEEACMHCGGVLAWGRCDCEDLCQSCWKRKVWCRTRVANEKTAKLNDGKETLN